MRHPPQLAMILPAQLRTVTLEPMDLWRRVRRLRTLGHRVYRAGRHVKLDGRLLSAAQFRRIAP